MPGVDIPAGDENTRERQETPEKETVLGLGKVQPAPTKPYGKREQNLGRILSSNCVQSVAHIQTCHKPSPTHTLVQITESYFFSLKATEQVKVSEYGGVTFNIDTVLPVYLCDSTRLEDFRGAALSPRTFIGQVGRSRGAWRLGEGERQGEQGALMT